MRVGGVGLDAIAEQYDISRDSVWRHMKDHVTEADKAAYLADVPLQEMLARAADEGVSLLDFFKIVRATLMKQFQLAACVNDRRAVASLKLATLNLTVGFLGGVSTLRYRCSGAEYSINRRLERSPWPLASTLGRSRMTTWRRSRSSSGEVLAIVVSIFRGFSTAWRNIPRQRDSQGTDICWKKRKELLVPFF